MAKIGWTTITAPVVAGTHSGYVAQIKTGDVPASMLSASSNLINGGGNLIAFTDATMTTRLPLDIVSCVTGGSPELLVYTRYDGSFVTNSTIYLIADDTQVVQPAVGAAYGRNAVWSDFDCVIHGNTLTPVDSTGNHTVVMGGSGHTLVSTAIGTGIQLNNTAGDSGANYIYVSPATLTDSTTNLYQSLLCDVRSTSSSQKMANLFDAGEAGSGSEHYLDIDSGNQRAVTSNNAATIALATAATGIQLLTQVIDGTTKLYRDGSLLNTDATATGSLQNITSVVIGRNGDDPTQGWDGILVEYFYIDNDTRSADYIATVEDNYNRTPATTWFTNDGWTESGGGGFKPYWARLANNLISYN